MIPTSERCHGHASLHLSQHQSASTDWHRDGCAKSEHILEGNAESQLSLLRRGTRNFGKRNVHQRCPLFGCGSAALAVFSWWTEFRAQQQICCDADDDESHDKHRHPISHFPSVCLSLEQTVQGRVTGHNAGYSRRLLLVVVCLVGGDGGRRLPEHLALAHHVVCGGRCRSIPIYEYTPLGIEWMALHGCPCQGYHCSILTKEFLRSVSVGIGSQKGVLRSLVGEDVLAVKDANPRNWKIWSAST